MVIHVSKRVNLEELHQKRDELQTYRYGCQGRGIRRSLLYLIASSESKYPFSKPVTFGYYM